VELLQPLARASEPALSAKSRPREGLTAGPRTDAAGATPLKHKEVPPSVLLKHVQSSAANATMPQSIFLFYIYSLY